MKRLMLSAVAGAALLAGATAANAQVYYDGGYSYGYGPAPFVERGVGLQVGPVGIGVYGPAYPAYGYSYGNPPLPFRGDSWHSTYNMRSYRAQEWLPQSPPGGGY